jgi:hypothetical protein
MLEVTVIRSGKLWLSGMGGGRGGGVELYCKSKQVLGPSTDVQDQTSIQQAQQKRHQTGEREVGGEGGGGWIK